MNPVDMSALAILLLSAVFGLARGFTREAFGLAAWVLAIFGAIHVFPLIAPTMHRAIENGQIADAASYALGFVVLLIVFSVLADVAGRAVRSTPFGSVDRALGIAFGLVRGAVIVVLVYVVAELAQAPAEWPAMVKQARATPLAYEGAVWASGFVPLSARPHVQAPGAPAIVGGKTI